MVLVTGGTGLLGTHLIHQLSQSGVMPKALYRSHIPAIIKDKAEWIQADILDVVALEDAFENVTHVYHCAGLVSFVAKDKTQLYAVNVDGTANVVNACLSEGVQKLIHVSSVAALGRIRPGQLIDESLQWTPETSNSEYGRTKFLGEMEVWRGMGEGLNAAIVNPSIILGEHGDWATGSMRIFKTVYDAFPWYSTGITGFVDADDVVKVMRLLMHNDVQNERFVVSGENAIYRDLFFMIADGFGKKRPQKKVTPFMAGLVWRMAKLASLFSGKPPFITKETARTSLAEARFSSRKLLQLMPEFAYTPLPETVKRICKQYKLFYNLP